MNLDALPLDPDVELWDEHWWTELLADEPEPGPFLLVPAIPPILRNHQDPR